MTHPRKQPGPRRLLLTMALLLAAGCGPTESERLARMAESSTEQQADQNQTMAQLHQQVAESHQRLVETEGDTREQVLEMQRELIEHAAAAREARHALLQQHQQTTAEARSRLDRRQEALDRRQRELADRQQRAPLVAAAITSLGVTLACLLPLLLAAYLLRTLAQRDSGEAELTDLLTQELLADRPASLPPSEWAALETDHPAALPAGSNDPPAEA